MAATTSGFGGRHLELLYLVDVGIVANGVPFNAVQELFPLPVSVVRPSHPSSGNTDSVTSKSGLDNKPSCCWDG